MIFISTYYIVAPVPHGRLRPGEAEVEGLRRKLTARLGKPGGSQAWQVTEHIGTWWRPHFDSPLYPYLPAHVTQPKECKKVFLVQLEEGHVLAVPKGIKLLAVPLFDVHDNGARYGPVIASVPNLVSRIDFSFV